MLTKEKDTELLIPVHSRLVEKGFSHPVLVCVIEERTLRFEALHLSPVGIVIAPLGSCVLRPDVDSESIMACRVLITAAKRCLCSLERLYVTVTQNTWSPLFQRSPVGLTSCALPDFTGTVFYSRYDFLST